MIKKALAISQKNWFKVLVFSFVLYFTFIIRAHNYDKIPDFGHLEELAFGWAGINLIETGVPMSWSTLDYPKSATVYTGLINYDGNPPVVSVDMRKPWLDQPPLFSLMSGYFAHIYGADRNQVLPSSYIRIPAIFLALITTIFLFLVARSLSGFYVGILTVLLYGTIPIFVFASRMSVAENFISTLYIISCFLILKFMDKQKAWYLIVVALFAGLAGISKATGFFLLPLALFFALKYKKYLLSVIMVLITLPFIAAFFGYGYYYDQNLFWIINSIQSHRPVGFSNLAWFMVSPAFDVETMTDTWYIFCLMATVFFLFKDWILEKSESKQKYVGFFILYWLLVVMFSGGEGDLLPWYRYPAFPLMALMGAWGIVLLLKNSNFVSSVIALSFFLGSRHFVVNAFRSNWSPMQFRIIFLTLISPSLLNLISPHKILEKLSKIAIVIFLVVGMYFNVVYIYNYFELKCESIQCPIGPPTFVSKLYFPVFWRFFTLGEPSRR